MGYIVWLLKKQKRDRDANSKGTMLFLVKENVYWALFADAIEDASSTYIFHSGQRMASATA